MTTSLEPSPEFARFLEWQTRTTLRRRALFGDAPHDGPAAIVEESPAGSPGSATRLSRRLMAVSRIAAIILVSMTLGAAGVVGASHVRDSRDVERLVAAHSIQVTLEESRVQAAAESVAAAELRVEEGFAPALSLLPLKESLLRAEENLQRLQIDGDEIRLARRAPVEGLTATTVGGRDFASERLTISIGAQQGVIELAQVELQAIQMQVEEGFMPVTASQDAGRRVRLLELELKHLEDRLTLRQSLTQGAIGLQEIVRLDGLLGVDLKAQRLRLQLGAQEEKREVNEMQVQEGLAPDRSAAIRLAIEEIEAELRLNELERSLYQER